MSQKIVAAEVVPAAGKAQSAAKELQRLGFRVLRVEPAVVSVQASEQVWGEVFGVQFKVKRQRRFAASKSSSAEHATPRGGRPDIPPSLRELIKEVIFVRPPEFF